MQEESNLPAASNGGKMSKEKVEEDSEEHVPEPETKDVRVDLIEHGLEDIAQPCFGVYDQ